MFGPFDLSSPLRLPHLECLLLLLLVDRSAWPAGDEVEGKSTDYGVRWTHQSRFFNLASVLSVCMLKIRHPGTKECALFWIFQDAACRRTRGLISASELDCLLATPS